MSDADVKTTHVSHWLDRLRAGDHAACDELRRGARNGQGP
jgi:hypothetical protein